MILAGICDDRPRAFAAQAPVGRMRQRNRRATARAISSTSGPKVVPKVSLNFGESYRPRPTRLIMPSEAS